MAVLQLAVHELTEDVKELLHTLQIIHKYSLENDEADLGLIHSISAPDSLEVSLSQSLDYYGPALDLT